MAIKFGALFSEMRDLSKRLDRNTNRAIQDAGLAAIETLVFETVVVTGRARGGWKVNLRTPNLTETGILDPDGSETARRGAAQIRRFRIQKKHGLFFSNAVPYIGLLDNRDGMVRLATEVFSSIVGNARYIE